MFSFDSQAACKRKQEIPILHGGKRLLGEKIQLQYFFGSQMQMWQISVITSQHWNYHSRLTKKRMISNSIYLIPGFSSLNTRREPHWISSRIKLDGTKVQYMRMLSHRCLQQKAIAFISSSHHRKYGNRFCNSF